jgi:hypothetical protein
MRPSSRVVGSVLVSGLVIATLTFWFAQLSSSAELTFTCTTPPRSMAQAIDARMHDPRARVDHLRSVDAEDGRYESLFFTSADVRVAGVLVGTGTWASNVGDFGSGDFQGWPQTPRYDSLVPVNDLARTISYNGGVLDDPGMTRAALFSQDCVNPPRDR